MLRVGYTAKLYPELRNIAHRVPGEDYVLVRDLFVLVRKLRGIPGVERTLPGLMGDSKFKFWDLDLHRVDLLHLFNQVSFGRTPWVNTFETFLPRYLERAAHLHHDPDRMRKDPVFLRGLDALASPQCRKLLALSESAARIQGRFLKPFSHVREKILRKVSVLHPPQPVWESPPEAEPERAEETDLRFTLVGHDFFRKGGREVLQVLKDLRSRASRPLRLTVVSKIRPDDYVTHTTAEDVSWARAFLRANRDWITHYPTLTPDEVLDLMTRSHAGLLPSYSETYGYTVLEFQSRGRPVITTDVRAFPEINSDEVGWVIPLSRDGDADWMGTGPEERLRVSREIAAGLEAAVRDILEDPGLLERKGAAARARIVRSHDPGAHSRRLREVYREAVA